MARFILSFLAAAFLAASSVCGKVVEVKTAGTLATLLTAEEQSTCTSLTVKGKLNSTDIKVLRAMAGYRESQGGPCGCLEELDLSEAKMQADSKPFMVLDAAAEHLAGLAMPARMVRLPLDDPQQGKVLKVGFEEVKYKISSYVPCFVLGGSADANPHAVGALGKDWTCSAGSYADFMWQLAEGDFDFHKGVDAEAWKELKHLGINRFPGHEIRQEGSRYVLSVSTQKGTFSHDTFYACPTLRTVTLPAKVKLDGSVEVAGSQVKYVRK